MHQGFVSMAMRMTYSYRHERFVVMLMVFVMKMFMVMFDALVGVSMLMAFRQMQPNACRHQNSGHCDPQRNRLPAPQRDDGPEERCY